MAPADRQLGPAVQEQDQGRVLRAARQVERRVVRALDDVLGDRMDHGEALGYCTLIAAALTTLADSSISAAHELVELRRRHLHGLGAQRREPLAHVGLAQDAVDVAVDLVDDIGGRSGGREHADPQVVVEALQPGLGDRRHVRQQAGTLGRSDAQRDQLAFTDVRQRGGDRREEIGGAPGHGVGQRLRRSLVGDVDRRQAGRQVELLGVDVRAAADARRREVEAARDSSVAGGDQVGGRLVPGRWRHHQHVGLAAERNDLDEILQGVVGQCRIDEGIDRLR